MVCKRLSFTVRTAISRQKKPYISTGVEPLTLTRPFVPALLRLILAAVKSAQEKLKRALALPEGPKGKSAAQRPALFETHFSLTGSKLASLGIVFFNKMQGTSRVL